MRKNSYKEISDSTAYMNHNKTKKKNARFIFFRIVITVESGPKK